MKITTAKQPLRTPCMTPMPSLWRGRQCDLTPTWTQFAQWYNTATRCLLQNPGNGHTEQCTLSSLLNKAHFSGLAGSPFPEEWQRRVVFFFFINWIKILLHVYHGEFYRDLAALWECLLTVYLLFLKRRLF